ncbi:hypothetical protein K474DRAFT_1671811 [Panus rudis PR-1116 ss-1]|nr:hypothetical protein K474DRAFT_1671811 [Panus rudis PR-1116 ss-1]
MLLSVLTLVVVLVLAPPTVLSKFNSISFSSVQQCGSFRVDFAGGKPPASLPLTLTVVPFNSTPISIPIPSSSWNSTTATGAWVTFLPLAADAEFVASLDDSLGFGTGRISNVIRVGPSDNTTCLPDSSTISTPRYAIKDESQLSQCSEFDVTYDPGTVDVPPAVRAFVLDQEAFLLNRTSLNLPGDAGYTMSVPKDEQVVLIFSDDTGFRQTSPLLQVTGNATSSSSCIPPPTRTGMDYRTATTAGSNSSRGGLSRTAVIAIGVVSGTVVGGIALAMALWIYRYRRRADQARAKGLEEASGPDDFGGGPEKKLAPDAWATSPAAISEKRSLPSPPPRPLRPSVDDNAARYVQNPPYVDRTITPPPLWMQQQPPEPSSIPDALQRAPLSSIPIPITTPLPLTAPTQPGERTARSDGVVTPRSTASSHPDSPLSIEDIEQILEMATMYNPSDLAQRSPEHMDTVTLASTAHSATILNSADPRLSQMPIPPLSRITGADGADITSAYLSSYYGAGSAALLSPAPPSAQWATQQRTPLTAAFRDPPQAPMPTTPMSEIMQVPPAFSRMEEVDLSSPARRMFDSGRIAPRVLPLEHSRKSSKESQTLSVSSVTNR